MNLRSVRMFVWRSCSSSTADQPWQVRYKMKANNQSKVHIIKGNVITTWFLRRQIFPDTKFKYCLSVLYDFLLKYPTNWSKKSVMWEQIAWGKLRLCSMQEKILFTCTHKQIITQFVTVWLQPDHLYT